MTDITHRRIFNIALPIVLSNATVPLMGAVDTAVIGQLGSATLMGAVAIGAIILSTFYWMFGFLRMSSSGLAAQAKGAGDGVEMAAILLRALMIALVAGVVMIVAQGPLFTLAFRVAPASAAVEDHARAYLAIRVWGAPATIAGYALTGWLIGLERTRAVLVLQLAQNLANIALTIGFVLGMGWGIAGVASATLIAEWGGVMLGLWLARDAFGAGLRRAWARIGDRAALARMFQSSRDILLRTLMLQLCFTTFVFLGARFGDVTLAANEILSQLFGITAFALDGFAFAAETLIGQAIGARRPDEVRRAARMSWQWGAGGALILSAVIAVMGPAIIDLMTTAPDVRVEARVYLGWMIAAPLIGVSSWILDGVFIGAMATGHMLRAMALSVAVYVVALLLLVPGFGNHGLWAALMGLNALRAVTLGRLLPQIVAKADAPGNPP